MSESLVLVKDWVRDQKNLPSSSFRAKIVRQTQKAVCLKLLDGREVWVPWVAVLSMEEASYLNISVRKANEKAVG